MKHCRRATVKEQRSNRRRHKKKMRPKRYREGYISVTEVIAMIGKPWLASWGYKTVAEKFKELVLKYGVKDNIDLYVKIAKAEPIRFRDQCAAIGKRVHNGVEIYLDTEDFSKASEKCKDDNEILILKEFVDYLSTQTYKEKKFIEVPMYSEIHGFAGTPDLLCETKLGWELRDWKIKTVQDKNELGMQMGGYAIVAEEEEGVKVVRAEGKRVGRDCSTDKTPLVFENIDEWKKKFLRLREMYRDLYNK